MTYRAVVLALLLVVELLSQMPTQQKHLRKCSERDFFWDNCIGTRTIANGAAQYTGEFHSDSFNGKGTLTLSNGESQYVGEFLADMFNGQGSLTYANGNKYSGGFRDGKFAGQGTYTYANGTKYVGQFRDGTFSGQGTYTYADGSTYVGEFGENQFNGYGTLTYPNGDVRAGEFRGGTSNGQGTQTYFNKGQYEGKYVGEFRDGVLSGHGTFTYTNGSTYVGEFQNGDFNGQGTLTSASGGKVDGRFKDGRYVGSAGHDDSSRLEVRLERQGGVLFVPVLINGRMLLDFIVDSGASEVSIPADVVSTLWRTGTLTDSDFTGNKTYLLADGSTMPSTTFRIRSLRVGERVLENVSGSIAPLNGSLLLGQSFLSRFKSWSVDNDRQVLVLQ